MSPDLREDSNRDNIRGDDDTESSDDTPSRKHCNDEWSCEQSSSSADSTDLENNILTVVAIGYMQCTGVGNYLDFLLSTSLPKKFTAEEGLLVVIPLDSTASQYFYQLFLATLLRILVTEINRYAEDCRLPLKPSGYRKCAFMEFVQVAVKCDPLDQTVGLSQRNLKIWRTVNQGA